MKQKRKAKSAAGIRVSPRLQIELLVVIAIIGLLLAILIPAYEGPGTSPRQ